MHLADGKLEDDGDGLFVLVLVDDLVEQLAGLLAVEALLQGGVAADLAVLVDDAQTDDLVAVVDELVDQPLEGKLGVVVLVGAAEESARPAAVRVVTVLGLERQREVGGILVVEGVERDALEEGAVHARLASFT